jgi:hypothetical protein
LNSIAPARYPFLSGGGEAAEIIANSSIEELAAKVRKILDEGA